MLVNSTNNIKSIAGKNYATLNEIRQWQAVSEQLCFTIPTMNWLKVISSCRFRSFNNIVLGETALLHLHSSVYTLQGEHHNFLICQLQNHH